MSTHHKHTPGPWISEVPPSHTLVTRRIVGPNGQPVASVGLPDGYTCGVFADVANARLIAAAPELLAALETLISYLEAQDRVGARVHPFAESVMPARAAIARATQQL